MLHGFLILLTCQLGGEGIVRGLNLPLPGPVVGIGLMLIWLAWRDRMPVHAIDAGVEETSQGLLRHFGLLFVPAGTGIVAQADIFLSHGIAVIAALVASTVLTLMMTAFVFRLFVNLSGKVRSDG